MSYFRIACAATLAIGAGSLKAQVDPGPRPGPAGAGSFFSTLNAAEQALFTLALAARGNSKFCPESDSSADFGGT